MASYVKYKIYFGLNDYYELFSIKEDYPELILKELIPLVKNKAVLDAGCGTGKYINKLSPFTKKICGVDVSKDQLKIASTKLGKNVKLICSDLENLMFKDETFDVIYLTWALSTVNSNKKDSNAKKDNVLTELLRVLKKNGKLIIVENDLGGEFEEIRGRYPDIFKTKQYLDWVETKGFKLIKKIKTHFLFDNKEIAKDVFKVIYGENASNKINNRKIKHNVVIYYLSKTQNIKNKDL